MWRGLNALLAKCGGTRQGATTLFYCGLMGLWASIKSASGWQALPDRSSRFALTACICRCPQNAQSSKQVGSLEHLHGSGGRSLTSSSGKAVSFSTESIPPIDVLLENKIGAD